MITECIVVCYMLGDVMLQLLQTFVAVLICGANNLTCLVIYSEHQPSEILVSQIRLIAQCREVLAQVIEVEIVLGFLELHHLVLWVITEVVEYLVYICHRRAISFAMISQNRLCP